MKRPTTRRRLRQLLADAAQAENDLLAELDRFHRLDLVLVAADVEQRDHGPIVRKSILWRQSVALVAAQAECAMPGAAVSLWAPLESAGDSLAVDQFGIGPLSGPTFNLYACLRPA